MRWLAPLLLAAALAVGDDVDDLLLRARHAQYVQGDLAQAITLYKQLLAKPLDGGRAAEVHLRVALCYEQLDDLAQAMRHLETGLFDKAAALQTRELAFAARERIRKRLPKHQQREPKSDAGRRNKELSADHVRKAQRALEQDDEMRAFWHTHNALKLDPQNAEAKALDAELETRLSGVADFVRDPLRFLGTWTEARVTQIARLAEAHLLKAVEHADRRAFNRAEGSFRSAIQVIDDCEFLDESDRLVTLRERVRLRWREVRARELGKGKAEPAIPAARRLPSLRGEFLADMQRMLDLVSAPGREYRIIPVRAPRRATPAGWIRKPPQLRLFRSLASTWSPALFARDYLPGRVARDTWTVRGNYLEAAGGMLVARNSPEVLDAVQEEVRNIAAPREALVRSRFLLVPVPRHRLADIQKKFGEFAASHRGRAVAHYCVLPPDLSLAYACSFLRDLGAEVQLRRDTFEVDLANGRPQTFYACAHLDSRPGYAGFGGDGGPVTETHYGALLDVYPLRDGGRTTLALRMASRVPAAPVRTRGRVVAARFLEEEGAVFVNIADGATLLVAGLADPFAARGDEEDRTLVLLWRNEGAAAATRPPERAPTAVAGAEVSLRALLVDIRDDPGPRRDDERGFVAPKSLDVLAERAAFLQDLLRRELGSGNIDVDVRNAIVRVPPALRENAAAMIAELERESEESYVIRVDTRAVRTAVLERWMARESLKPQKLGDALVAVSDAPSGAFLLRNLDPGEPDDVFAPRRAWSKPTALGLQMRHVLSARMRTSPTYEDVGELASAATRTIAEGLRVGVRPYRRGGRLRASLDVELTVLESEEEGRALTLALPSYRARAGGARVRGELDFGPQDRPGTVLLRGIAHPSSRPDKLTEIVIAVSIRHVP